MLGTKCICICALMNSTNSITHVNVCVSKMYVLCTDKLANKVEQSKYANAKVNVIEQLCIIRRRNNRQTGKL